MKTDIEAASPNEVSRPADYLALIKSRLMLLVLISVCMGFFISADQEASLATLFWALAGIYCIGGGANTLNQWIERDIDVLMLRTQGRPLPSNRVAPLNALLFGFIISFVGFILITTFVNTLTLVLSFTSWAGYLFIYTPLKTRTVLNTWIGAIPGALPAVLGCAAATGTLSEAAFIIFLVLYVWQMPHFFAISWIYRKDYLKGGFKMLSWDDELGTKTAKQILIHALILLPVSSSLFLNGHSGLIYFVVAIAAGLIFIFLSAQFYFSPSIKGAKKVFYFSIVYLPVLFFSIVVDKALIYL